jgi:hypothetical protein
MQYNIAMIVLVMLGAVVIADGNIQSKHVEQNRLSLRATVLAMSPQQLASSIADCDPVRPAGEHVRHNSTFCTEVNRALDEQRLQIVDVRPLSIYLPLSLPPLRLRKPAIVPLALPDDPGSRMVIFPVAKAS